jgi:hypothetical protein
MRLRNVPVRLTAGLFILNAGLGKLSADEGTAGALHGMASTAYPQFSGLEPARFTKLLAVSETALGATLLTPVVPPALAGAGLVAFASGLLGLYFRTPGMRREDGIRPSQQGTAVAKDVWLLGMGLSLIFDGLTGRGE